MHYLSNPTKPFFSYRKCVESKEKCVESKEISTPVIET